MEAVKMYKANDGKLFDDHNKCVEYEAALSLIKSVTDVLKPVPDTCGFANGDGYVQQDITKVNSAKARIVQLGCTILGITKPISFEIAGRYFDDSSHHSLYNAWYRLACIDITGKEWGQPYYANNPSKGEQVELQP